MTKKKRKHAIYFDPDEGRTQQHFRDQVDVNNIVARYRDTGIIEHVARSKPQFGDCTGQSFADAMWLVGEVKSEFAHLPSEIRAHFDNNPEKFLEAAHDPAQQEILAKLGLIEPSQENAPEAPPEDPSGSQNIPSGDENIPEMDIT